MPGDVKIKVRVVQSTQWRPHYDGGNVVTTLKLNDYEIFVDKREFTKHDSYKYTEECAVETVVALLAQTIGDLMRQGSSDG